MSSFTTEKHGSVGSPQVRTYYSILGVPKDATVADIAFAYGMLSLKWHPDKHNYVNAEERFKELSQAYIVLSDSSRKKKYDDAIEFSFMDNSSAVQNSCGQAHPIYQFGSCSMNNASSTFAEFMDEGWMRGQFADEDENYIIVDVPMDIAQAGGNMALCGPDGKRTKVKISGFLSSRLRPMLKKTYMWGKDMWLVFRVRLPPVLGTSEKISQILWDLFDVLMAAVLLMTAIAVARELTPQSGSLKSLALVTLLIIISLVSFLRVLWRCLKKRVTSPRKEMGKCHTYTEHSVNRTETGSSK